MSVHKESTGTWRVIYRYPTLFNPHCSNPMVLVERRQSILSHGMKMQVIKNGYIIGAANAHQTVKYLQNNRAWETVPTSKMHR